MQKRFGFLLFVFSCVCSVATAHPLDGDRTDTLVGEQIILNQSVNVPANTSLFQLENGQRLPNSNRLFREKGCLILLNQAPSVDSVLRKRTMTITETTETGSIDNAALAMISLRMGDAAVLGVICLVEKHGPKSNVGQLRQALQAAGMSLQFVQPQEF
jgi:hypothetical protein